MPFSITIQHSLRFFVCCSPLSRSLCRCRFDFQFYIFTHPSNSYAHAGSSIAQPLLLHLFTSNRTPSNLLKNKYFLPQLLLLVVVCLAMAYRKSNQPNGVYIFVWKRCSALNAAFSCRLWMFIVVCDIRFVAHRHAMRRRMLPRPPLVAGGAGRNRTFHF